MSNKLAQILPSLILGTGFIYWSQSTETEVYALNAFFVTAVSFFFIKFHNSKEVKYFLIGSLLFALSLGNHLTMVTLLPAIFYITIATDVRLLLRARVLVAILLFMGIGFAQYFYLIYLSHSGSPIHEYLGANADLGRFFDYITGGQFRDKLGGYTIPEQIGISIPSFLEQASKDLGLIGLILAATAILFFIYRRVLGVKNRIIAFLIIALTCELLFTINYRIVDIAVFYIPVYIFASILISYVIEIPTHRLARLLLILIVIVIPISNIFSNFSELRVTYNPRQERARHLANSLPPHSTLYYPYSVGEKVFYPQQQAALYYTYCHNCDRTKSIVSSIPKDRPFFFVDTSLDEITKLHGFKTSIHQPGQNLAQVLEELTEHTVIISVKNESTGGLTSETKRYLKDIGLNIDHLGHRGSYVALMKNREVLKERINNDGPAELSAEEVDIPGIDLILSAGLNHGNESIIEINGRNESPNVRGMNIVILADNLDVIKSFAVDTFNTDMVIPEIYKAEPFYTVRDVSGNKNHGLLVNDPYRVTGKIHAGVGFDGVNDYISLGDVHRFEDQAPFTVSLWAKDSGASGRFDRVVSKESLGDPREGWLLLRHNQQDKYGFERWQRGTKETVEVPYATGLWNHIAFTYDGSFLRGYLNGVLAKGPVASSIKIQPVMNPLTVGALVDGGPNFYSGQIDDLRIYDRALDDENIAELAQELELAPNLSLIDGLIGHWKFNELLTVDPN